MKNYVKPELKVVETDENDIVITSMQDDNFTEEENPWFRS